MGKCIQNQWENASNIDGKINRKSIENLWKFDKQILRKSTKKTSRINEN